MSQGEWVRAQPGSSAWHSKHGTTSSMRTHAHTQPRERSASLPIHRGPNAPVCTWTKSRRSNPAPCSASSSLPKCSAYKIFKCIHHSRQSLNGLLASVLHVQHSGKLPLLSCYDRAQVSLKDAQKCTGKHAHTHSFTLYLISSMIASTTRTGKRPQFAASAA